MVVYDVTSRTSFTHAKKLLHIIHSCSHTNLHLPFSFSSEACSCRVREFPLRWDMSHRRAENVSILPKSDETVKDYEDFSVDTESSRLSLYLANRASQTAHSEHNQRQIANHQVYTCYEAEPQPSDPCDFISHGGRNPVGEEWYRSRRMAGGGPHYSACPCHNSPSGTNSNRHLQHCPSYGHYATLQSGATTNHCLSNYYKGTVFPSHITCDSADNIPVTKRLGCDNGEGKKWSLSETVRRMENGRNFEPCDDRQKCGCLYERYPTGASLRPSCGQVLTDHNTLDHLDCFPPRGGCVTTSPQRKHTTLLLGNKRDLEHIR